ncbi:lipopolysaccharide transport periplasmic protein LptA [Campylobacter sp. RM16187]|uniref:lipopolysaccharide transport periplasmic protein LptA n=1 Tax=Campylobacter sp. RM16187 TaxID=1660063 RepID=UPI0021B569D3|nr:lipopolysaccharide transport periplasmic protein LptA [Campylobacter sp. RM16187]QKG28962.1 putative lipooligosaccharide transport system, periplasmic component (LptA family) [Campylobacter sp. RM16187]
MGARKKIILAFVFSILPLVAQNVEVTADDFFADENKFISELSGNVSVKKGKDILTADKVVIHFDKNRNPIKYVATGNAKFKVLIKDKNYNGSGNELVYELKSNLYTINGSGFLHEVDSDKRVYGEKISVNQNSGTYSVNSGNKKPVKFVFQVEDKKK